MYRYTIWYHDFNSAFRKYETNNRQRAQDFWDYASLAKSMVSPRP